MREGRNENLREGTKAALVSQRPPGWVADTTGRSATGMVVQKASFAREQDLYLSCLWNRFSVHLSDSQNNKAPRFPIRKLSRTCLCPSPELVLSNYFHTELLG